MLSIVTVMLALVMQLAQAPAAPIPAPPAQTTPAPPAQTDPVAPVPAPPAAPVPLDPATSAFPGTAGLLLTAIKPAAVADYELVVRTLQKAMAKTADPQRQRVAKGWLVFKTVEGDSKGNVLYVHVLLPAEPGFDYRMSLLVDEMVQDLPPDLLSKYRDAFAAPPTKLSLTEFANMSMAPVAPVAPATPVPPVKPVAPTGKLPGGD